MRERQLCLGPEPAIVETVLVVALITGTLGGVEPRGSARHGTRFRGGAIWESGDALNKDLEAAGPACYLAAAWTSSPSRPLRRAAKRSDTAGGIVELATDAIRAGGFCGMRFGHVRAWATTDSLKSAPQSWQR